MMCSCSFGFWIKDQLLSAGHVAPEDAHGPPVASHVRPCLRHDALQDLATIRVTEILVSCYLAIMIANDVACEDSLEFRLHAPERPSV